MGNRSLPLAIRTVLPPKENVAKRNAHQPVHVGNFFFFFFFTIGLTFHQKPLLIGKFGTHWDVNSVFFVGLAIEKTCMGSMCND